MLNLTSILETNARERGNETALVFGDTEITHADLNHRVNCVAQGLVAAGIQPGERVALACGNNPCFPSCYYGIMKAGAVAVLLNVLHKRAELQHELEDCGAVAMLAWEGTPQLPLREEAWAAFAATPGCRHFWLLREGLADASSGTYPGWEELVEGRSGEFAAAATGAEDVASIIYTSGTTGRSKGVELTHLNLFMHAPILRDILGYAPGEVALVGVPFTHAFGHTALLNAGLFGGARLIVLPRFTPDAALQAMQDRRVTVFVGVPTMCWGLLHHPRRDTYDLDAIRRHLRVCLVGGASVSPELQREFEEVFGTTILEGYGLSECTGGACLNRMDRPRKRGAVGQPIWGTEVCVVDDEFTRLPPGQAGEVLIRGHHVMKGYHNNPEATAQVIRGGWLRTGDVGRLDEDGYLYIVDRIKDMVIRGGRNVYPRQVEERLMTHPSVRQAAVVGVPDEKYGEEIVAFVVAEPEATLSGEELVAWGRDNLPAYMYPRKVVFCKALPQGPTGKVLKQSLRDRATGTRLI